MRLKHGMLSSIAAIEHQTLLGGTSCTIAGGGGATLVSHDGKGTEVKLTTDGSFPMKPAAGKLVT